MGYIIPWKTFSDTFKLDIEPIIGHKFNYVNDIEFCTKYIPQSTQKENTSVKSNPLTKLIKKYDKIIPGTFEFHYDTKQLGEYIQMLEPTDSISITVKVHGCSGIFSKIPIRRDLSIFEKIKKIFGFKIQETEMSNVYSSRKVIKSQNINKKKSKGFYEVNIWNKVNEVLKPLIPDNTIIYGEIVGYEAGTQRCIQHDPDYDYGCKPGEWKFMPYRINENGREWGVREVIEWTIKQRNKNSLLHSYLMPMKLLYYGKLKDLYPVIDTNEPTWRNLFLMFIKNDIRFGIESDEPLCKNKVPREGIVIRINGDKFKRAWKFKSVKFCEIECKKNDRCEIDLEDISE